MEIPSDLAARESGPGVTSGHSGDHGRGRDDDPVDVAGRDSSTTTTSAPTGFSQLGSLSEETTGALQHAGERFARKA